MNTEKNPKNYSISYFLRSSIKKLLFLKTKAQVFEAGEGFGVFVASYKNFSYKENVCTCICKR